MSTAFGTYRCAGIAWPGARSSGWCGLASPVVPAGASLLTLWVVARSNVITDAIAITIATARPNRITALRCSFIYEPPKAKVGQNCPGSVAIDRAWGLRSGRAGAVIAHSRE